MAGTGRQGQAAAAPPCLSIPAELFDTRNFCTLVYRKLLPPGLLPAPEVRQHGRLQSIRGSSFACLHCWQHHAYPVEREQATPAAHQGVRGLRAGTRGSRGAQPTWLGPPKHHPVELPMCGGMPHWRPLRPPMRGPAAPAAGTCGGRGAHVCMWQLEIRQVLPVRHSRRMQIMSQLT